MGSVDLWTQGRHYRPCNICTILHLNLEDDHNDLQHWSKVRKNEKKSNKIKNNSPHLDYIQRFFIYFER